MRGRRWNWRCRAFRLRGDGRAATSARFGIAQAVDVHDDALANRALGIDTSPRMPAPAAARRQPRGLPLARRAVRLVRSRSPGLDPAPGRRLLRRGTDAASSMVEAAPGARRRAAPVAGGHRRGEPPLPGRAHGSAGGRWPIAIDRPRTELGAALGSASVLVVPNPPNPYTTSPSRSSSSTRWPAGRLVQRRGRSEHARIIIERRESGVGPRGWRRSSGRADRPPPARHRTLRERLGANARGAAEQEYDWWVYRRPVGRGRSGVYDARVAPVAARL